MLISYINSNSEVSPIEMKYLCGLYIDRNSKVSFSKFEGTDITNMTNEDIINHTVKNFLPSNNIKENTMKVKSFLLGLCQNHKKNDIIYLYAKSKGMLQIINNHIKKNISREVVLFSIEKIQLHFANEAKKYYSDDFQYEDSIYKYLTNSYKKFYVNTYSHVLYDYINVGTIFYTNSEGESHSKLERENLSEFERPQPNFNIPDFLLIARSIFNSSIEMRFVQKTGKIGDELNYDIFSCYKMIELEKRVRNFSESYIELTGRKIAIKAIDIYYEKYKNTYTSRTYPVRKRLLEFLLGINLNLPYTELYNIVRNAIGSEKGASLFGIQSNGHIDKKQCQTLIGIIDGVKVLKNFLYALNSNNIDPLVVPSDIFQKKDLQFKGMTFEVYMKMLDSFKTLSNKDNTNGNNYNDFRNNKSFLKNLGPIKNIKLDSIKSVSKRGDLYIELNSHENFQEIRTMQDNLATIYNTECCTLYNSAIYLNDIVYRVKGHLSFYEEKGIQKWNSTNNIVMLVNTVIKSNNEEIYNNLKIVLDNYFNLLGEPDINLNYILSQTKNDEQGSVRYSMEVRERLGKYINEDIVIFTLTYAFNLKQIVSNLHNFISSLNNKNLLELKDLFNANSKLLEAFSNKELFNYEELRTTLTFQTGHNIEDLRENVRRYMDTQLEIIYNKVRVHIDLLIDLYISDKNKSSTLNINEDIFANYGETLSSHSNYLIVLGRRNLSEKFKKDCSTFIEYKNYMLCKTTGKPITMNTLGQLYYLHKSGFYVNVKEPKFLPYE